MLILTRRVGETIVIGNQVFCTVLDHDRAGQLKLAFDAPKTMPINRFEIQRQIIKKINDGSYECEVNWDETVLEKLTKQFSKNQWN